MISTTNHAHIRSVIQIDDSTFISQFKSDNLTFRLYSTHAPKTSNNNKKNVTKLYSCEEYPSIDCESHMENHRCTFSFGMQVMHLAFVLACGSRTELRMRILSPALLASALEMSTLRPWPHISTASLLGHNMPICFLH